MDGDRFDSLAKLSRTWTTRRSALALLTGLGLGTLAPAGAGARKSGRCKPKCGACERCKRGDCERKHGKKRCKQGKCRPKTNGAPCASGSCQGGRCTVTAPFCTGKNVCEDGNVTEFPCHQSGTTPCVCVVDAITGAPVCVQSPFTNSGCKAADPCRDSEICVDATGGLCGGGTAKCALPCPNPL
jgi:hypothetical protein